MLGHRRLELARHGAGGHQHHLYSDAARAAPERGEEERRVAPIDAVAHRGTGTGAQQQLDDHDRRSGGVGMRERCRRLGQERARVVAVERERAEAHRVRHRARRVAQRGVRRRTAMLLPHVTARHCVGRQLQRRGGARRANAVRLRAIVQQQLDELRRQRRHGERQRARGVAVAVVAAAAADRGRRAAAAHRCVGVGASGEHELGNNEVLVALAARVA
mmetsp:Transcript_27910/g.67827  ORF Transcript_27910/g.67827 Transcript_27910/m.67827 type:complete len:218 (-) Transcript_27910:172-825(-)